MDTYGRFGFAVGHEGDKVAISAQEPGKRATTVLSEAQFRLLLADLNEWAQKQGLA